MIPSYDEPRRHVSWETALDRLELEVRRAERLVADPTSGDLDPWDAPLVAGPLPPHLVDRALELRARQQAVQARVVGALATLSRHSAFAQRVDRATARATRPVYLDVTA